MNDEQVVLSLISFYKKEGIDLHNILDDPLFISLPLASKVQAIKKFAGDIKENMGKGVSMADTKGLMSTIIYSAIGGGITGFSAGAATSKLFKGGINPFESALMGAGVGIGAGAASFALDSVKRINDKRRLRAYLTELSESPSDENAFNTIALRNRQVGAKPSPYYTKLVDKAYGVAEEKAKTVGMQESVKHNTDLGKEWNKQ